LTLHIPVVCAHFYSIFSLLLLLNIGLEDHNLDILNRHGIADQFNRKFLTVVPELVFETIKDCTGVAVFLCHALLQHSEQHLSRKLVVFFLVNLRYGLTFLRLFSFEGFFKFSDSKLVFLLSLEQIVGCLFCKRMVAFLPVVNKLVHSHNCSLVLLRHVIHSNCLSASSWAE